ncbi:MAG: AAA family ATPase, partial [Deltaproteobacteria bacterium]|nr:AAA family ATPase [Deltaproteobacteria bacterium]
MSHPTQTNSPPPAVLISALRGSAGKTLVSLGLVVALRRKGIKVLPFKKGPDYIDASWLSQAAGVPCRHLDGYLMGDDGVVKAFTSQLYRGDCSVIEGNRGLFDGVDIKGTFSTARIASLLNVPVILVIDCTKATNTVAALVLGCLHFDKGVHIAGVVLNRVAGRRHESVITESIRHHTGVPVVGVLPKLDIKMPERHLGLVTAAESDCEQILEAHGDLFEKYIGVDRVLDLAGFNPQAPLIHKTHKAECIAIKHEGFHVWRYAPDTTRADTMQKLMPKRVEKTFQG